MVIQAHGQTKHCLHMKQKSIQDRLQPTGKTVKDTRIEKSRVQIWAHFC